MGLDAVDQAVQRSAPQASALPIPANTAVLHDPKFLPRFESLGLDCEFGLVQRMEGLEPLGLLRWASTYPRQLIDMLETQFEGFGSPDHTTVDLGSSGEWQARDKRYFGMHTFISNPKLGPVLFTRQMSRRFKFLKDKLLEDLELAEKIFVYTKYDGGVADADLRRMSAALRAYGPNNLMYVRRPDRPEQDGTVIDWGQGVIIGYLSDLTADPQAVRQYHLKWKRLCQIAWPLAHP